MLQLLQHQQVPFFYPSKSSKFVYILGGGGSLKQMNTKFHFSGKPNGKSCKDDVDCASKHCCGLVTDVFGLSTGTCAECCADRHCAAGQKCELEGLLSWKYVCKKKWFGR